MSKPAEVIWLSGLVRGWRFEGGYLVLDTISEVFNPLLVRVVSIPYSIDKMWEFTGVVEVVPENEVDEAVRAAYRRLKAMDVELEWRGLIRKRAHFIAWRGLRPLEEKFGLKPSRELVSRILGDRELMELINSAKPSSLKILLEAASEDQLVDPSLAGLSPDEAYAVIMERYYRDPRRLAWYVIVEQYFLGVRMGRTARIIYKILERLARILREVAEEEITRARSTLT